MRPSNRPAWPLGSSHKPASCRWPGALKNGVDAARGLSRGGSWTRIWRRLFHRHEYFLAQTNSQAIALTNALPQVQQLWEIPKIGGYLERFARATQQMGHVLRE